MASKKLAQEFQPPHDGATRRRPFWPTRDTNSCRSSEQSNDKEHDMHGNPDSSTNITNDKHLYNNTQNIKPGSLKSNNNDKNITQIDKTNKTKSSSSSSYSSSSSGSSSDSNETTLKEDCIINKNTILAYYKKKESLK